jgi:murein DD-endopeptidase MepM/ murein hydrolase activator NlpD
MSRQKYKLNPESLDFEIIKIPLRRKTQRFFVLFLASVILFIIYAITYSHFFESPKTMILKTKASNIKLKYDLLLKDIENADKTISEINNRDQNVYRTIFGLDKAPYKKNRKNANLQKGYLLHNVSNTFTNFDDFRYKVYIQSKSFDEISRYAFNMEKMVSCMPSIPPVDLKKVRISDGFGWRTRHPIFGDARPHNGMDFAGNIGTPIYATGDGTVSRTVHSNSKLGYGNQIDIDHGFGYSTRYAHLSKILVESGMQVKRGDLIGLLGNTGQVSGPHLHYEVRYNNEAKNPKKFYVNESTDVSYDEIINRPR